MALFTEKPNVCKSPAPARAERQRDFISGFCGETEEEHQDTLSLVKVVQYDQAFVFVYSCTRRRTPAAP